MHVVTLDLLGHGRSDRPADPLVYSTTDFVAPGDRAAGPPGRRAGRHRGHLAGCQRLPRGGGQRPRPGARPAAGDAGAQQRGRGGDPRLRAAAVRRPVPAGHGHRGPAAHPADPAGPGAVLDRASCSTPSTSGRPRSPRWCTACSSAGWRRPHVSAGRSRRRPWSSGTRPTRSTRPRTPRCWPRSCRTPPSSRRAASSSGGWRPHRLNEAAVEFARSCWETPRRRRRTGS